MNKNNSINKNNLKKTSEVNYIEIIKSFLIKFGLIISFMLSLYLLYQNYKNIDFALELKRRLEISKSKFEKAKQEEILANIKVKDSESDEAKERYEKEFFNKTSEGETVVILHKGNEVKNNKEKEKIQFNFVDRQLQKINLWWKNL